MSRSEQLYQNLMRLSQIDDSPFYHVDHVNPHDGFTYRVFSYRLGSYTDFLEDDALECRGHMFRLVGNDVELVSVPFQKFFNVAENPFTMGLDFSRDNIEHIAVKEDGSLISTYLDNSGVLRLKSKTSLTSSMAEASMELLPEITNPAASYSLHELCETLENEGYTVSMEYIGPSNRIVLPYDKHDLVVLGVRNRETLEYMTYEDMEFSGIAPYYTAHNILNDIDEDTEEYVDSIKNMKGIEGFVIRLKDGLMVKVKTDEYVSLHHAKDSVSSPKRLMGVVLEEATDDLRQMFSDDEQALREIENMERFVTHLVNHLVKNAEEFYENNKNLERKDFAIKGQKELEKDQFSLAMAKYSGKEINYKSFVFKNHKKYLENYETTLIMENEDEDN
jgi:T4 RnlA family RNA ligase